jgi:long-chain acyl-CoA synthetase
MLVHRFLENAAARFPDKTALICENQRLTYGQLDAFADHLATAFIAMGVKRQDRVVIFLENSVESVVSLYAVLKAGAVFVMLHPGMKAGKLKFILKDAGACAVITHSAKSSIVLTAVSDLTELEHIIWCGKGPASESLRANSKTSYTWDSIFNGRAAQYELPGNRIIDLDLATIVYTSGSTGEPKGVVSAHYNVVAAVTSITDYLKNRQDDIILCTLPLSFDYGLYQTFMTPFFCGTLVLEKSFVFPIRIIERLVQEKVTGFPIVPTMAAILSRMETLSEYDFSSLRYITNTAAALHVSYIRKLQSQFPNVAIYSMYGLTECKRALYLPPEELDSRPASVGIAVPNSEVFVVDKDGNEVDPGKTGELVVRGLNVMQGYWNRPEETASTFRPGRYRGEALLYTGDLFRKDDEGFLYFVGRKDDMIKTKGERVSPKEIENMLCSMPGVAEAVVLGVPDDIFVQAIKAYIVSEKAISLTSDEIMQYCSKNLEPFMVPKYVEFRQSLPKSPTGKIDKKLLSGSVMAGGENRSNGRS